MALLPYLEWVSYRDLRTLFWKYIDHHTDGGLRYIIYKLKVDGLIEKKYEGSPPALNDKYRLSKYLYVRRVSKTCPRTMDGIQKKLDGTFGIKAKRERALREKRARTRKPPKKTILNLTLDDCKFIKDNPYGMTRKERSEMFNIHMGSVQDIINGHIPDHLKGPLAR